MKTVQNTISADLSLYPYDKIAPLEELLFMDIETTGFLARSSNLYMIGCAYYKDNGFHTIQWFAENYQEEELLLYHFFNFAADFSYLVHFNGNHFDIPYLQAKCLQFDLTYDFKKLQGIDIYKRILPYKSFLKLGSMKQKALEDLMGLKRDDTYTGGQLISVYCEYVEDPSEFSLQLLLLHNYEDLRGMVRLVPILAVSDLFNEPIKVERAGRNPYRDIDGNQCGEIIMEIKLPQALPFPISYGWTDCYFTAEGNKGKLRVALVEGEMKYFYPDYKDYYYLPSEDIAIHKSVATYVDKGHREQAKASNCYGKKAGQFLPEWDPIFEPVFRHEYHDKTMYFELDEDFKKNSKFFTKYAEHVLKIMAHPVV